jgi:hypothetical protein
MRPLLFIATAAAVALSHPARAADHSNLEEGLPVQVEDAYPIAKGGREIQALFRYDRTKDGTDRLVLDPRVELGIARNAQLKLSLPVIGGSADERNSGDLGVEAFYNFTQETLALPAIAASVRADFPTGKESAGVDTTWKILASKSVGATSVLQRVHVNLTLKRNAAARADERREHYAAAVGYSRRVGPDTMLVADLLREQEKERGEAMSLVEVGIRRQLTPLTVVAAGVGTGVSSDAPRLRVTFALQHSF